MFMYVYGVCLSELMCVWCVGMSVSVSVCTCVCVSVYVCMYVCMCVYVCLCGVCMYGVNVCVSV